MVNNYRIRFTSPTKGELTLPINPEKLPVSRDTANDDYNVLGIGPIMVPRIPELKKITISSYLPGRINLMTLTPEEFKAPEVYINFFDEAMLNKEILVYTVQRYYENGEPYMTQDNGFPVLVTNFQYEERGGETGDFYFDLELTEYVDYSPQRILLTGETDSETGAAIATTEQTRSIPQGQLYVGIKAVVNGAYYYSSYGDEPHGNGSGRACVVSRIEEDREYPVHITTENGGSLGWVKKDALQVVNDN